MIDYLFRYFGGNKLYTQEEWNVIKERNYDVIEVDTEMNEATRVFKENCSYEGAFDTLTRVSIKDFDFEIRMIDSETKKVLAVEKFHPEHNGQISVVREDN